MADLEQLTSLVDLRQREVAQLKASVVDRDRQIAALRAASRQPSVTTDRSQGSANGRRSAKQDGPGIYKGDGNDSVTFEYWHRQLKNKLAVNADHFDDDEAKRIYIESRLSGTAAQNLEPYLEEGHPNQIVTSEQLLTHLWSQYRNPSKSEDALRDYNNLVMGPTDEFFDFKNTFVRLAGECRKPKAEWKTEFNRKLTIALKTAMAASYRDLNVDFEQFALVASDIATSFKQAKQDKAARQATAGGSSAGTGREWPLKGSPKPSGGNGRSRSSFNRSSTPKSTTSDSARHTRPQGEELRKLIAENRCFICREKGHIGMNCPFLKKKPPATIQELYAHVDEEQVREAEAELDLYYSDVGNEEENTDADPKN